MVAAEFLKMHNYIFPKLGERSRASGELVIFYVFSFTLTCLLDCKIRKSYDAFLEFHFMCVYRDKTDLR